MRMDDGARRICRSRTRFRGRVAALEKMATRPSDNPRDTSAQAEAKS